MQKIFLFSKTSRPTLGLIQPSIEWVPGFFPRGKAAGAWSNHSPPSRAEVKNEWMWVDLYFFSPYVLSWRGQSKLYIDHYLKINDKYLKWLRLVSLTKFKRYLNNCVDLLLTFSICSEHCISKCICLPGEIYSTNVACPIPLDWLAHLVLQLNFTSSLTSHEKFTAEYMGYVYSIHMIMKRTVESRKATGMRLQRQKETAELMAVVFAIIWSPFQGVLQ